MKITRLETLHVRPRWLFLKIHTDAGLVGLGEPILEGRALTVETAVHEIGRTLIGEDPRRIEWIWNRYFRGTFYRGGPILCSAISGIDQALWDILGKHLNVPVHQLLGGSVRDRIRLYGWVKDADGIDDYVAQAQRQTEAHGFTAFKMAPIEAAKLLESRPPLAAAVGRMARLRERLGAGVDLALDLHGRASSAVARQLARELEPYHPFFLEEPVLPGSWQALREVRDSTSIPIAAGERLFTRWQFRDIIVNRAVDVVQPDVSHAGGISELRKIGAMAEVEEIAVAPHCPLGPIALASSLHVDATLYNFLIQEAMTLGEGYLKKPFEVADGHVAVPQGPGLGIELDDEAIERQRFDGQWETPQFRHSDGSFAEW